MEGHINGIRLEKRQGFRCRVRPPFTFSRARRRGWLQERRSAGPAFPTSSVRRWSCTWNFRLTSISKNSLDWPVRLTLQWTGASLDWTKPSRTASEAWSVSMSWSVAREIYEGFKRIMTMEDRIDRL